MTLPNRPRPWHRLLASLAVVALSWPAIAAEPVAPDAPKPGPATAPAAAAPAVPPPKATPPPVPAERPAEIIPETPISIPPPVPTGILIAWKPMILKVLVDNGEGTKFGSDKLSPLRFLARYTHLFDENMPFVGRIEVEGGEFKSDIQSTQFYGSTGADLTGRATFGAATRITQGVTVLASLGAITRYQYGKVQGGAPTVGLFGAVSNMEFEFRLQPSITLSLFAEAALVPWSYYVQTNLGDLSDGSEFRARIQLSFDLTRYSALDVGYDFTRWHATFVSSSILGQTGQALVLENREHAMTMGVRWKL